MKKTYCDRCGDEMTSNHWEKARGIIVTNYPVKNPFNDLCEECLNEYLSIIQKNQKKIKEFVDKQKKEREDFIYRMVAVRK